VGLRLRHGAHLEVVGERLRHPRRPVRHVVHRA
jgi:hypothetical protein